MDVRATVTLNDLKDLLRRFAAERQDWPPELAANELGALILCLMRQADVLGVDLVRAGESYLQHINRPLTLVPNTRSARAES